MKTDYFLDFYCPACGRKHENVQHDRRSEDETYVFRYGINCPCGKELGMYASLDWDYVDVVAKGLDGETTVREVVEHETTI